MDIAVWVVTHPPIEGMQVPPEAFEHQDQAEEWARLANMNPDTEWKVFQVFWKDRQGGETTIDFNRRTLQASGLLRE